MPFQLSIFSSLPSLLLRPFCHHFVHKPMVRWNFFGEYKQMKLVNIVYLPCSLVELLLVGSVQLGVDCNLGLLLFCFITPRLVIGPENSRLFLGTLREILSKKQWRWFTVQHENFTSLFFSSMLFCLWRNEFFQLEMTAISVGTVQLEQFQFSIPGLLWFHSTLLCDWSRTPALFSQPIRFKTQNNRD